MMTYPVWLLYLSTVCVLSCFERVSSQSNCKVSVSREPWGVRYDPISQKNVTITRYTLENCNKIRVKVISYGASITSVITPDYQGNLADIVQGFENIEGYANETNQFMGATLGRFANKIAHGRFNLTVNNVNVQYNLTENKAGNTIHGGPGSFGKVFWNDCSNNSETAVVLCHESPDGESGFPGHVRANITYTLNAGNELRIKYQATTDKPTPINMANHAYFNLAGHNAGSKELYKHVVEIRADKYTPVNKKLLPTGEIKNVDGTPYDFRNWTVLGLAIALNGSKQLIDGFDTNYVLSCNEKDLTSKTPCMAARVFHPDTKRVLFVFTNQPGMQFYTSNNLHVTSGGKENATYGKHSSFCMMTQHFPDSVNHPNFPNTIIYPNETYAYESIYRFETGEF